MHSHIYWTTLRKIAINDFISLKGLIYLVEPLCSIFIHGKKITFKIQHWTEKKGTCFRKYEIDLPL